MGSFNVACGVSNLSINYGENVVFIPLIKNFSESKSVTSLFLYNDALYQPFLLPIKGIYNDYGQIGDIKKDNNIKLIETVYGYSIEQILESISEETILSKLDGYEELPKLGGMFVLESIFNEICSIDFQEEYNRVVSFFDLKYYKELYINHTILNKLGFSFFKKNSENIIYKKGNSFVYLYEYYVRIGELKDDIYKVDNFIKLWNKTTKDTLSIELLYGFNYIAEKIKDELKQIDKNPDSEMVKIFDKRKVFDNNLFLSKWKNFDIYINEYTKRKDENILNSLIEMYKFNNIMIAGNILYRPSYNGMQFGINSVSKFILKSSLKHLNK